MANPTFILPFCPEKTGFRIGLVGIFALLWLFPTPLVFSQRPAPIGQWTAYVSHRATVDITSKGNVIYSLTEGGLYTLDKNSMEVRSYSTIEGLHSLDGTTLHHDPETGNIFIGYSDGTINYFGETDDIRYITDIRRSDQFTNKKIRKLTTRDNYLYIATDFGLVVYDVEKDETRFSVLKVGNVPSNTPVLSVAVAHDSLWILLDLEGLFKAPLNHPNLTQPDVWVKEGNSQGLPDLEGTQLATILDGTANEILFASIRDTVWQKLPGQRWTHSPMPPRFYNYLNSYNNQLFGVYGSSSLVALFPDSSLVEIDNEGTVACMHVDGNGEIWVGDGVIGMQRYHYGSGFYERVSPAGPKNNLVTEMAAGNGELYIAPRGRKPPVAYYGKDDGFYYHNQTEGWKILDWKGGELPQNMTQDFARVCYDPVSKHAFLGSWQKGIIEMMEGDTLATYTSKNGLSPATFTASGDSTTRVSGLALDSYGNLWVTLALGNEILNVRTPDGQWFRYPNVSGLPIGILVDDFDNKWILNHGGGLVVFNDYGTLTDLSDDQVKYLNTGFGTGGLPSLNVLDIAKDLDGQVWIGTIEGITVFYDPSSMFNEYYEDASCPVVDGYCLLRDQQVSAIAVDGANRKWIGTANGLILLNDEGTEELMKFTTENSPLFDNDIKEIAIDQSTGEVFIGTNKGVISYMGEAIGGKKDSEGLLVFPNPVMEDYDGPIAITCGVDQGRLKIASVSGAVVREIEAFGGQAIWDGRDTSGNKVKPGIYMALIANKNGEGPGFAKIAIVQRKP